ncbi:CD0519/CD1768 family membrane protein [[Clostridium] hylemonae]|uniref:Transporter gate domain protein n=2 Tax=[Clostridium] hylemonae TaxID=89153 RepID=C0C060_9FIRM|nr:hypothetical protein [[Clostridium] hylemonae]EEG74788.1 transporter gate domain protein [[Clostridium] hylemonae DSM 15053]MCB7520269.1 hypothetical protein [[Clostridium] hylemonae]QEK18800.1 hypothetical protein LAJLEIBI_02822 [[Clostridium] hylemonae DSM 15053]BDF05805.1 membrane protein [[Clostridium] hylemonae]
MGTENKHYKKAISVEAFIFLGIFLLIFGFMASRMGGVNMMNTLMNTAYKLLLDTVFYIMAIAVLAGAISGLFSEFGVISMINKALSPLMKPLYNLPGAAALGVITTYLSDNPAILGLAEDRNFRKYFRKFQLPALTNLGTSFGMGMIVSTFMIGLNVKGGHAGLAVIVGNVGAVIGSIISVRIMMQFTKKTYGTAEYCIPLEKGENAEQLFKFREVREGSAGGRAIEALLTGGKGGVDVGLAIIPGVLAICTLVMMLTNGPSESGVYTGAAYEGVALLPWIGEKIQFILTPLFGFTDPSAISVPITALGAAGAAIGLVPNMVETGAAAANDIAVFTAMCMCWSGYLSTHVAMMSSLGANKLTGKAILSHTIGGICAGVAANWLFKLAVLIL